MASFSSALENFQRGACSFEQLKDLIARDIVTGTDQAQIMIAQLNTHNSSHPLGPEVLTSIEQCIWQAETTRQTQFDNSRTRPSGPGSTGSAFTGSTSQFPTEQTGNSTAPRDRAVRVGDTINGRFILEEKIGQGGMSQVFRALDKRKREARSRNLYVALKIMHVEGIDPGDAFVAMQREAQKTQALNHPNILQVNDFDRDGSTVYTTMELLSGDSLQAVIANAGADGVPLDEVISITNKMGDALAFAHDNKIIHADFKPSNVFITDSGVVKVIDFGIARAIQAPDIPEQDKTVFDPRALGALTPAYASPEMLENKEPDPRDDVYALGCVVYELITGRHPFSRLRATDARDNKHPLKQPKRINQRQWAAIRQALSFEQVDRTPTIRKFLDDLNKQPYRELLKYIKPTLGVVALSLVFAAGYQWWVSRPETSLGVIPDCPNCPALLAVSAGSSDIGLPRTLEKGMFEYPVHSITIENEFLLGAREVTVAEFADYVDDVGGSYFGCRSASSQWQPDSSLSWEDPGFPQTENHPVTCVSWNDATGYAAWLSSRTGESFRLPSESEWEYAAREASELPISMQADANSCEEINVADQTALEAFPGLVVSDCQDGFVYTAPTDRNSMDTFSDLRGNVYEWTQDCWNPSYLGAPSDGSAWEAGDCRFRVLRGGSWYTAPKQQRLTYRNRFEPNYRSNTFGFRIAGDIHETPSK